MVKKQFYFHCIDPQLYYKPNGDHGVMHTYRVMYLADKLSEQYPLTDEEYRILMCACCYHDIGRTHDWEDWEHGRDSVNICVQKDLFQNFQLSKEHIIWAKQLMIYHAIPDNNFSCSDDRLCLLYKIIKDADAIDRLRFDDLDESFLRLPYSKELIALEHELLKNLLLPTNM